MTLDLKLKKLSFAKWLLLKIAKIPSLYKKMHLSLKDPENEIRLALGVAASIPILTIWYGFLAFVVIPLSLMLGIHAKYRMETDS